MDAPIDLAVPTEAAVALLLAMIRVGTFAAVSPLLPSTLPLPGRLTVVVALSVALAGLSGGVEGLTGLGDLLGAGVVNAAIGGALGWLTGVIVNLFGMAGDMIDVTSGLSVAMVFDPARGDQAAVFGRMYGLVALAALYAIGGLEVVVRGLAATVRALPLDGSIAVDGRLAEIAVDLVGRLMVVSLEVAMPVLAALFLVEVVLGLASRLAPQANVFLLGLPGKLLITILMVSTGFLLFPEALEGALGVITDTFEDGIRALTPRG